MPVYKYECEECGFVFEKLISSSENSETYSCLSCDSTAHKILGKANFNFKSNRKQGNTGVHDIDYPGIDKAVGRSAEDRWGHFYERRKAEDKARESYGTQYLGKVPLGPHTDGYYQVSNEKLEERRHAAKELHEALTET